MRGQYSGMKLENVGQVVAGLNRYPSDTSLRQVNLDFLKAVSRAVRNIVEAPKSERNLRKALNINLSIHNDVLSQFDRWSADPREFWHPQSGDANRYSELSSSTDKARGFYSSLLQLQSNVAQSQIRWRIGTISAYLDYRKFTQGASKQLAKPCIQRWLNSIQWYTGEAEVEKCRQIILAGRRRYEFCELLGAAAPDQATTVCYSAMFLAEATDSWDHKTSINKSGLADMVAELCGRNIHAWHQTPVCNELATNLLQFNENMFLDETRMTESRWSGERQALRAMASISRQHTAPHLPSPDSDAAAISTSGTREQTPQGQFQPRYPGPGAAQGYTELHRDLFSSLPLPTSFPEGGAEGPTAAFADVTVNGILINDCSPFNLDNSCLGWVSTSENICLES